MKKILIGALLLTGMSAYAQETYENANIATEDLNGTARYVGMGGAMEALGADISTMGSNPAGIGVFRKSQVSMSFGLVSQADAPSYRYGDATNASFDQIGFVWATNMGDNHYLNYGFNYHKSRNFDYILGAANTLNGASQNKITAAKGYEGCYSTSNTYNQADYLNENVLGLYDETNGWSYYDADKFAMNRANKGYIGEYDFNISGKVSNALYLGMTIGISDVHYKGFSDYTETLLNNMDQEIGTVNTYDERRIEGTGFNIKAGAIIRPVEDSPFRIGLYVHTPTWYDLTTTNYTYMTNGLDTQYGAYDNGQNDETYDFRMFTPWKFGVALGHTIAGCVALGATYEYADYGSIRSRVISDNGYDPYYGSNSYNDDVMNDNTDMCLKGTSTLKLGAEFRLMPEFSVRAGYNLVSAMYDADGYKDGTLNSPGSYYTSSTDYTNWKTTNRFTLGLGYSKNNFGFDVAYQFSQTNGDFYPFMSYYGEVAEEDCVADATSVSNQRHQIVATLSYKF